MKHKTLVAIVIARTCITLISCYWLFGKKPSAEKKSIVGKWKLESIENITHQDSSGLFDIFSSKTVAKDSSHNVAIEFKDDSSYHIFTKNVGNDSGTASL